MILQALVDYYEAMAKQGKLAKPGWCEAKISYGLNISPEGDLLDVVSMKISVQKGKKTVETPQGIIMPEATKRSSNVAAQFLWDNSRYVLGMDKDPKNKRARECFTAMTKKCDEVLSGTDTFGANALKNFFAKWNPTDGYSNSLLLPYLDEILSGINITFLVNGHLLSEDESISSAWDTYYSAKATGSCGICPVTGKRAPIARLHHNIKGVKDAQSSGAALVSFNASAFKSYGHEQGMNANISEYAAFAYTTALNNLLAAEKHHQILGDTTVVFWTKNANDGCSDFLSNFLSDHIEDRDLKDFFEAIARGKPLTYNGLDINPSDKFYILGISPNAARLSVRFFLVNTFGYFMENIAEFYNDFAIVKPSYDEKEHLAIWKILLETANKNSKDKASSPLLVGAFLRTLLTGSNYPEALYQNILLRTKADQDNPDKYIQKVNRIKAAVIKAYLIRNKKEVITMVLDKEKNDPGYVMGRLFAVLEQLQEEANPGINSTIKDRYFNSACSTPGIVFPILLKLANSHKRKLSDRKGLAIHYDKEIGALVGKVEEIPIRLDLKEQGEFILGYYHQVQYRYTKKEDK